MFKCLKEFIGMGGGGGGGVGNGGDSAAGADDSRSNEPMILRYGGCWGFCRGGPPPLGKLGDRLGKVAVQTGNCGGEYSSSGLRKNVVVEEACWYTCGGAVRLGK